MIEEAAKLIAKEMEFKDLNFSFYPRGKGALNTILFFDEGKLKVVAKYSVKNSFKVRRLSRILDKISKCISGTEIAETVPAKINISSKLNKNVHFHRALKGTPIKNRIKGVYKKEKVIKLLGRSIKWLSCFHGYCSRVTKKKNTYNYVGNFINRDIGRQFLGPMHGDFVCSNIIIHNGKVKVIDWEEYTINGIPFVDVFFVIVSFASQFSSEPIKLALYSDNWFSNCVSDSIRKYCEDRNVDLDILRESVSLYLDYSIYYSKKRGMSKKLTRLKKIKSKHDKNKIIW